jgi:hypothetical protein
MSISRIPPNGVYGAAVAGTPRRIQHGIPRPSMIKPSKPIERSVTAREMLEWCASKKLSSEQTAVVGLMIVDLGLAETP